MCRGFAWRFCFFAKEGVEPFKPPTRKHVFDRRESVRVRDIFAEPQFARSADRQVCVAAFGWGDEPSEFGVENRRCVKAGADANDKHSRVFCTLGPVYDGAQVGRINVA